MRSSKPTSRCATRAGIRSTLHTRHLRTICSTMSIRCWCVHSCFNSLLRSSAVHGMLSCSKMQGLFIIVHQISRADALIGSPQFEFSGPTGGAVVPFVSVSATLEKSIAFICGTLWLLMQQTLLAHSRRLQEVAIGSCVVPMPAESLSS